MPGPRPWSADRLAAIPDDVQPTDGDRVLCRLCGNLYRSLGRHLAGTRHGISPDAYRAQFQLPVTRSLVAADLRATLQGHAKTRLAGNPAVREAFGIDRPGFDPVRDQRRRNGLRRKAETASRAGVQRSKQAVGQLLGELSKQQAATIHADRERRARQLGPYTSLDHFLHETAHLPARDVAALLECGPSTVAMLRRSAGITGTAKQAAAATRAANAATATGQTDGTGHQPVANDGTLQCLECPTSWDFLARHIEQTHLLTLDAYRIRHHLRADQPLISAQHQQQIATRMRQGPEAAGRRHHEHALHRHNERARTADYTDLHDLLRQQTNQHVADILGIRADGVSRLRRKHLPEPGEKASARTTQARRRHDTAARQAGFDDVIDLLTRTEPKAAAEILGLSTPRIRQLIKSYNS